MQNKDAGNMHRNAVLFILVHSSLKQGRVYWPFIMAYFRGEYL